MAGTTLKNMSIIASKFNPGVKIMKKSLQQLPSQKAFCCTFPFSYCALFFLIAQELPNKHNNWKLHYTWPFQLLHTHTLYFYMKGTWVNIQKPFKTTNANPDSTLISKIGHFVIFINGFYQILLSHTTPSWCCRGPLSSSKWVKDLPIEMLHICSKTSWSWGREPQTKIRWSQGSMY